MDTKHLLFTVEIFYIKFQKNQEWNKFKFVHSENFITFVHVLIFFLSLLSHQIFIIQTYIQTFVHCVGTTKKEIAPCIHTHTHSYLIKQKHTEISRNLKKK